MQRVLSWVLFLLLATAIVPLQRVEACSCQMDHPQTQFCRSDFVVLVRVKKIVPMIDYEIAYKVRIIKKFKADLKSESALKSGLLYTASSGNMCGAEMQLGKTYVVGGGLMSKKPTISLCGLNLLWPEVSPRQRKGFRRLYQHSCVCNIRYTAWWRKGIEINHTAGKMCLWESTPGPQDCQEKHGICMKGAAGCSWVPSVPYKNCIKDYQRMREEQRAREP